MRYCKDFLLTDDFFVRGHVNTGSCRLTTYLNGAGRQFIEIDEALCIKRDGKCIQAPRAVLSVSEILLAHEACEAGDAAQRSLASRAAGTTDVTIHLIAREPYEIKAKVRRSTFKRDDFGPHQFIVVTEPRIQGLNGAAAFMNRFPDPLSYLIVNRDRVALVHS